MYDYGGSYTSGHAFHMTFEPRHEIMVLFVLLKLILKTRMQCNPVGLDV